MEEFCPLCMNLHKKERVKIQEEGLKENVFTAEYYYCKETDSLYTDERLSRVNNRMEILSRNLLLGAR